MALLGTKCTLASATSVASPSATRRTRRNSRPSRRISRKAKRSAKPRGRRKPASAARSRRGADAAVALAKDIQDQEYSLTVLESRLTDLEAESTQRSTALGRRDAQMREALMALERLALHPGDALTLTPLAPDDAVRTAILLRAAVPAISTSANSAATRSRRSLSPAQPDRRPARKGGGGRGSAGGQAGRS